LIETQGREQSAVFVGLIHQGQEERTVLDYLEELKFLAETAGYIGDKSFWQRLEKPHPATFIGTGKLEEIKEYVEEHKTDIVIFDDDLSPSQLRNIEKELKRRIYDRSLLILEIFRSRARTAQAKTQVELAHYQYLLPRLTRMWTHLERQRGGTGTRGGAGEKEIETDRRVIRNKIALLKEKLEELDRQSTTQRKHRKSQVRVALVGYTNVGKSTLMNLLSKSDVFAENKLFATLDTTVRKVVFKNLPFLLSDTVGFIRKLPHALVESFKSTLDEVRESDVLLHVVDISHPNFEEHIAVVQQTLTELGASDKPAILVFNKTDMYRHLDEGEFDYTANQRQNVSVADLKKTWMAKTHLKCVFISAAQKDNISELRDAMYAEIEKIYREKYPYQHYLY
jgi:GTP-binding protein HflX